VQATLLRRNSSLRTTLLRQCIVRYNESSVDASPLMSAWTSEQLDRDTCLKAHKSERLTLQGQTIELGVGGSRRQRVLGKATIRDYEITLKTYLASTSKYFNMLTVADRGIWCNYDDFECDFEGGKLFWEQEDCRSEYTALFTGSFQILQVPEGKLFAMTDIGNMQVAFQLSELHSLCSELAYSTTSWDWEIVLNTPGVLLSVPHFDFDVGLCDDVVYHEEQEEGKYSQSALQVIRRLCESQKAQAKARIQRMRETLAWDNAAQGRMVEIAGDDIVLKVCSPVQVRIRPTGQCYSNRLPIYDHFGREKFLSLKSRRIVDNATTIPCSERKTEKVKVVPISKFEDFLSFVHRVGAVSSGLWSMRFVLSLVFEFWWTMIAARVWGVQPAVQQTNDSKFRKFAQWIKSEIDVFFTLIAPPFYS